MQHSTTEYAKRVHHALIDKEMSVNTLVAAVQEQTGLFFDRSYLSKILNGKNHPAKIMSAINEILGIEGTK